MDLIRKRLEMAEKHVALGLEHIARQTEIVEELRRNGRDPTMAETLLKVFQEIQVSHEVDRDRLKQKLPDLG